MKMKTETQKNITEKQEHHKEKPQKRTIMRRILFYITTQAIHRRRRIGRRVRRMQVIRVGEEHTEEKNIDK